MGLIQHVRVNAIAYLALFVALGGTGYAVSKIGAGDIKRDAIRAKHIKERSVGKRLGTSIYFGQALDFGPVSPNTGFSLGVPLLGRDHADVALPDDEGGGYLLLAPVRLRFRDLRATTLSPATRPVWITAERSAEFVNTPLLRCVIPAGQTSCRKRGPSPLLKPGEVGTISLEAPIAAGTLPERDYLYSVRVVPG